MPLLSYGMLPRGRAEAEPLFAQRLKRLPPGRWVPPDGLPIIFHCKTRLRLVNPFLAVGSPPVELSLHRAKVKRSTFSLPARPARRKGLNDTFAIANVAAMNAFYEFD